MTAKGCCKCSTDCCAIVAVMAKKWWPASHVASDRTPDTPYSSWTIHESAMEVPSQGPVNCHGGTLRGPLKVLA